MVATLWVVVGVLCGLISCLLFLYKRLESVGSLSEVLGSTRVWDV